MLEGKQHAKWSGLIDSVHSFSVSAKVRLLRPEVKHVGEKGNVSSAIPPLRRSLKRSGCLEDTHVDFLLGGICPEPISILFLPSNS